MCVAAAIVGGAIIGGVATTVAGNKASSATKDATRRANQQQQRGLDQQAALSQPYRDLGASAIPQLQNLLGLNGADQTAALRQTPGYQFSLNEGLTSTKNAAAASGLLNSGNTLEGLDRFATGLADSTYQQQLGNYENVVGLGQAAAAGQAANIGNASSTISNNLINQGNTQAGITANTIAGITRSIGQGSNNLTTLAALQGQNTGSDVSAGMFL